MRTGALVALAHGSPDPRSAGAIADIVADVRAERPDLHARGAFLDHNEPRLADVVDTLVEAGHDEIVVAPLLFTSAFHARVDVPEAVAAAQRRHPEVDVRLAEVIGADPALLDTVDERLEAGLSAGSLPDALVLACAGSTDRAATQAMVELARLWGLRRGLPALAAFASAAAPSPAEAVHHWRQLGRRRVAVGSLFFGPGRLPDRVRADALEAGAVAVGGVLGASPAVRRLVLARYDASCWRPAALL